MLTHAYKYKPGIHDTSPDWDMKHVEDEKQNGIPDGPIEGAKAKSHVP